jgi:uncharacterized protein YecT (DUF1311 family)
MAITTSPRLDLLPLILTAAMPLASAQAASFSCARPNALSSIERMICENRELSALDDRLAALFRATGAASNPELQQAQREWLIERDRCTGAACVRTAYENRISTLMAEAGSGQSGSLSPRTAALPGPSGTPTQTPSVPPGSADPLRNAASAARRWDLPMLRGLPTFDFQLRAGSAQPVLPRLGYSGSQRYGDQLTDERRNWARAIFALGLSQAPRVLEQADDERLRLLACFMLSDADIATVLGPGRNAVGIPRGCAAEFDNQLDASLIASQGAAIFRTRYLPNLIRNAPELPFTALATTAAMLSAYDMARGGFRLLHSVTNSPGSPTKVFGTPLRVQFPTFLPMSPAEARSFLSQREASGDRSGRSAQVYIAMPLTFHGITPPPPGASSRWSIETALPEGALWLFEPGEISVYSDAPLSRLIGRFDAPAPPPIAGIHSVGAAVPRPTAPIAFNADSASLLLLQSRAPAAAAIGWHQLARARFDAEQQQRDRPERDPWGTFFPGLPWPAASSEGPWVDAFREWSVKRSTVLPETLEIRRSVSAPLAGSEPRSIPVLGQAPGLESIGHLGTSALSAQLRERGMEPSQMLPFSVRVSNGVEVRAVLPADVDSYRLDIAREVPAALNRGQAPVLTVEVAPVGLEEIGHGQTGSPRLILLRLSPRRATLRHGGETIASTDFERVAWRAPTPAPAAPPRPTPAEQLEAGPYGPDMVGLRLGMTIGEAEALIRAHMPVTREWQSVPPTEGDQRAIGFLRARLFVGANDEERITIFEAPMVAPGRVVALWRRVRIGRNAWPQVMDALTEKYGSPTSQDHGSATWATPPGAAAQCRPNTGAHFRNWRAGDQVLEVGPSQPTEFPDLSRVVSPGGSGPLPGHYDSCGPALRAVNHFSGRALSAGTTTIPIILHLADLRILAWLAEQQERPQPPPLRQRF